ncbi:Tau-tubulin kinase 1 [Dirofilaria immitis]|nr:Tau-tubulin kinase 1 [Dirofilaria immitis]
MASIGICLDASDVNILEPGLISMLLVLVHCSAETPNLIHPDYLKIAKYWCYGWLAVNLCLQTAHRWTIGDTVITNDIENILFQIDSLICIIIGAAWLAFPGWLLHRQVRISLSESHEFCARFMGTDFLTAYVITNHALHWKKLGDRLVALDARILICALTFAAQVWSQYAYSEHWNGGHWVGILLVSSWILMTAVLRYHSTAQIGQANEKRNCINLSLKPRRLMGKEDLRKIKLKIGSIVKNQWQIIRRIGEGGCGLVFQVVNMQNPIQMAAMKTEPIGMFSDDQILKMERFTLPTSVKLCIQCLEGIEDLHNIGFIHRDVKPSNFAMGRKPSVMRTVFMLDFGLARQYCTFDEKGNSKLREPRKTAPFRGTIRYCSINVHCGDEQGRHDDLWSLLYMTAEMILGTLPCVMRSKKLKASDEKFEIDKGDKSDMNTRMGIKTIEEEINITSLLKEEDEEGASRVSGVSRTDDTLQKLDELK